MIFGKVLDVYLWWNVESLSECLYSDSLLSGTDFCQGRVGECVEDRKSAKEGLGGEVAEVSIRLLMELWLLIYVSKKKVN